MILLNLFKRKSKVEDSITGLNGYWRLKNLTLPNKKIRKIIALKKKIKEIELEIKEIEGMKTCEDEIIFKPIAKRIGYHLSIITNTQARFVYNPPDGAGFSLEVNGVPKYRIFLKKNIGGVGLHTWRYKLPDDGFTAEYNRIEPILVKIDGSIIHDFSDYGSISHDFSDYNSDGKIIALLEQNCKTKEA